MNQTTTLLVAVVAWTIVAAMVALRLAGLTFPISDIVQPGLVCIGLAAAAYWYRHTPNFFLCLTSLAVLVAFSTAFVLLSYAIVTTPWPLADAALDRWDAMFGISAEGIRHWIAQRPMLDTTLWLIYFSLIPQTVVVIAVLGLRNSPALSQFLLRFMLCAWVTAVCFYFLPARGSCGDTVPPYYAGVVRDVTELHSGIRQVVTWRNAEGLVTFPSFHAIWAILLALALRWWPITLLNVVLIFSTIPTGMHYAIDIVGGLLICGFVIPFADRLLAAVGQPFQADKHALPTSAIGCKA